MKKPTENKLYLSSSMYNRLFIFNYVLKQLKNDYSNFKIITLNKDDKAKIIYRDQNNCYENKSFIASGCGSWSGIYSGFIVNNSYYYFQLDDNAFFNGLFYRIILDDNNNYIGMRYAYTEDDLFKDDLLRYAIKINYFDGFDLWHKYSNKTLLKYARIYYKKYFLTYFLNIKNSEIVYEKKRVCNYYNSGFHYENIYDKKQYNIFNKH